MLEDNLAAYLLSEIQVHCDLQAESIKRLSDENAKLKAEHYYDGEIARLESELDELQKSAQRGFFISEAEAESIEKWRREHMSTCSCNNTGGLVPKDVTYEFTRTALGDSGTVRCACGETYCFHDCLDYL